MSVCTCEELVTDEFVWHFDWLCLKKEIKMLPVRIVCALRGELCVVFCKKCFMKLKTESRPKMCVWFCRFDVWFWCLRFRFQKL